MARWGGKTWRSAKIEMLAVLALACMAGSALAQSMPAPYLTGYRYLAGGVLAGKISPAPSGTSNFLATRNTYDANGRLWKIESGVLAAWQDDSIAPSAWTGFTVGKSETFGYDADGRKTSDAIAGADGITVSVTQFSYDAFDRLICSTVRMNASAFASLPADACVPGTEGSDGPDRITKNAYDDLNHVIQVRKAVTTAIEQAYVTYSYTLDGQREYIIDANGNRSKLVYDGHDRNVGLYFPSPTGPTAFDPVSQTTALATAGAINAGDHEDYAYDPNGNRISLRKRDGSIIGYSYDALNRVAVKDIPPPGTSPLDVFYDYDLQGHQLYAHFGWSGGQGTTSSYDGFGRLATSTSTMAGFSRSLSYAYDPDGNRTCIVHPDGSYFNTDYDGMDRATATYENGSGGVCSKAGAPVIFTIGYDAQGQRGSITRASNANTTYGYDPAQRLNSLSHALTGTPGGQAWALTYNPASQIKTLTSANDAYAWNGGVDAGKAYTINGLNQYTAVAGAPFSYDDNANLTSDGSTAYGYDVENRLVSASGAHSASLAYDPNGRLFQTSSPASKWGTAVWGMNIWSADSTQFLYDGDALVAEYDSAGHLLRRYVHGPGMDEPLVWYEGAGLSDRRFLHGDHQGSVVAVSGASGQALSVNSYDEYGVQGTGNTGRFQYTGQIWLPEAGLYHYKARAYAPTLGRFMQTDPVGYDSDVNLYAYVGNDPVNDADPEGRESACITLQNCGRAAQTPEEQRQATATLIGLGAVVSGGLLASAMLPAAGAAALSEAPAITEATANVAEMIAPGSGAAALAGAGVKAYQSGSAAELKAASIKGDDLDIHHAPQAHVAEQITSDYSRSSGPAIAVPKAEHQNMPVMKGQISMDVRKMLAQEARALRGYTDASNRQIQDWLSKAKQYFGAER